MKNSMGWHRLQPGQAVCMVGFEIFVTYILSLQAESLPCLLIKSFRVESLDLDLLRIEARWSRSWHSRCLRRAECLLRTLRRPRRPQKRNRRLSW